MRTIRNKLRAISSCCRGTATPPLVLCWRQSWACCKATKSMDWIETIN